MSPEQVRPDQVVSPRTDLWSLGVVLFEGLSGRVPFAAGESDKFKIARAIEDDGQPAPELSDIIDEVGAVSENMAAFVHRCLEKDLAKQFRTAQEMAAQLSATLVMPGDVASRTAATAMKRLTMPAAGSA